MPQDSIAYAVARTRVLEAGLMTREKLRRMMDAPSAQDVMRLLVEAGYGNGEGDYETMIADELSRVYAYIREITPNVHATNVFLFRHDSHNLKAVLKAKMLGSNPEALLVDMGTVPKDKVKEAAEGVIEALPPHMAQAVQRIYLRIESGTMDARAVDYELDAACFADMEEAAGLSNDLLVQTYVKAQADLLNLRTMLRLKKAGQSANTLQHALVPGGSIAHADFLSALMSNNEEMYSKLGLSKYEKAVKQGLEQYNQTGSLALLEKQSDDYLMRLLHDKKYETLTMAPILGYLIGKEREAQAIRLLMVAKLNGAPQAIVEERLRELYA